MKKNKIMIIAPFVNLVFFAIVAIITWRGLPENIFYLYNFGYIGIAFSTGLFLFFALPKKKAGVGRRIAQLLVGLYMLVFWGLLNHENMQLEGSIFYIMLGIFAGSVLHFLIAKVTGPLISSRAWCGWGCWTAMLLDFLPWKRPVSGRLRFLGGIRYIHFGASILIVLFAWFILKINSLSSYNEFFWLLIGNAIYYVLGIALAIILKDNRAFCKYLCPIPALQKIGARFALIKLKIRKDKCIDCGLCEKTCPMNIKLLEYKNENKRILSTECIMCIECMTACPKSAIALSVGFDAGLREHLNMKQPMYLKEKQKIVV